eukprot:gb/GEZJ01003219.1/.p1 GENE.gb/GEZJ01003219.1/~~gb/GEZJ01003219.1/.p1  ORF type:complete len:437 (+),score=54.63 gb/GEZJ01003219.1/:1407-2717(+)
MSLWIVSACVFVCLVCSGTGKRSIVHTSGSAETLLQYGSAQSSQTFELELSKHEKVMETWVNSSDTRVMTTHELSTKTTPDKKLKISAKLFFDFLPGDVNYTVAVSTQTGGGQQKLYTIQLAHSVYGAVFFDDKNGKIQVISGDYGVGYNMSRHVDLSDEPFRVKWMVHVAEGTELEPSIEVVGGRKDRAILDEEDVVLDQQGLVMMARPFRTGSAMVVIRAENVEVDGEQFETAIAVNIADTDADEADVVLVQKGVQKVVMGGNGSVEVAMSMLNVKDASKLELVLDDSVLGAVVEESNVTGATEQRIVFRGRARGGKFRARVRVRVRVGGGASEGKEAVSLYKTFVWIGRAGERERGEGVSVVGIVGIVFGCVAVGVAALMGRVVWARRRCKLGEMEHGESEDAVWRGWFGADEGAETEEVVRDRYGRGGQAEV